MSVNSRTRSPDLIVFMEALVAYHSPRGDDTIDARPDATAVPAVPAVPTPHLHAATSAPTVAQLAASSVRVVFGGDLTVTVAPVAATRSGYATLAYRIEAAYAMPRTTHTTSCFYSETPSAINDDMWLSPLRAAIALHIKKANSVVCVVTVPSGESSHTTRTLAYMRSAHAAEWALGHDNCVCDCDCGNEREHGDERRYRKPTVKSLLTWQVRAIVLPQLPELMQASLLLGKARAIEGLDDAVKQEPLTLDALLPPCGHALALCTFNRLARGTATTAQCPLCRANMQAERMRSLWC